MLKIAILAEKYAENLIWYVNVIVQLIKNAEVENDIWYRILQIITGTSNFTQASGIQTSSFNITQPTKCTLP